MKVINLLLLAFVLLVGGCTKDTNQPQGQGTTALLSVGTRSVVSEDNEGRIDNVRMVAFRVDQNSADRWLDANSGMKSLPGGGEITQLLTTGMRDIYIFANEDRISGMDAQLDALSVSSKLNDIKIPYTSPLSALFFYSYVEKGLKVKVSGNEKLNAQVVRTVAKVVLNLTQTWEVAPAKEVVIDRVQVMGLPKYSYLIGKTYDDTKFVNSEVAADLVNGSTKSNTYQKTFTFYIPEFLGATVDKHAYIEIQGHIKENSGITCTYRCPLGDGMATDPMADYNITRNTHFTVNGTIKGYGQTNQLEIEATVQDWNTVNSTQEELGEYVKIKSIKAGTTDLATNPDYKWNRNGETITVELEANVGGTLLEIKDNNNKVLAASKVSNATDASLTINLPANIGMDGGKTHVTLRDLTLYVTNSNAKIHYSSTVASDKITISHAQGGIVWDSKNLGATNIEDGGNIFQFNRNFAFAPTTTTSPIAATKGPMNTVTAELVQNQFIYRDIIGGSSTSTPEEMRAWSNDGGGSSWQSGNNNPCTNNNSLKRIPTIEDCEVLLTIAETSSTQVHNIPGRHYTISNLDRMFIPHTGYREWHEPGPVSGIGGHGILWSCTKMTGTDVNRGQVFRSEVPIIGNYANAVGFSLRCVQYID